jgi:hypothetical protein
MQHINRRQLMKLAGFSTAALAGVGLGSVGQALLERRDALRFRAMVGLPQAPLPSYATYVVEGALDLASRSGVIASRVLAGHPDARSEIGLPGLGRIITVTGIQERGNQLTIHGVIEDRSQLQRGESAQVDLVLDRARGVIQAPLGGRSVTLTMT